MLYQPVPMDFTRNILVFVHAPKTGGTAFDEALEAHFGPDNCIFTRVEKIGKIHPDRVQKAFWTARKFARNSVLRLRGIHPLMRREHQTLDLNRLRVLTGHFALGAEPRIGRDPIYVSLVRDPVDRFLSDYYYRFDIRSRWSDRKRERHSFWLYDVDRFVDFVYARKGWTQTNLQCRYLGGEDNFGAARKAIDECVFLAAPLSRMKEFFELLRPVLDFNSIAAHRANIGRARQDKAPPSEKSLAKIREMVSEDQRLFDYVSEAFDDVYNEFGQIIQTA